ncbi:hypothetical protein AAU61_10705 [Desulfocarbo indianensis]|nr:hypothetical protein AAU61_10705 [Desulfocarbo indianensis]
MGDLDRAKELTLQVLEKKQKRMMMKDLLKEIQKIDESVDKKVLKKATSEMIMEKTIAYWSSGSTTYFALPGGKHAEGEE